MRAPTEAAGGRRPRWIESGRRPSGALAAIDQCVWKLGERAGVANGTTRSIVPLTLALVNLRRLGATLRSAAARSPGRAAQTQRASGQPSQADWRRASGAQTGPRLIGFPARALWGGISSGLQNLSICFHLSVCWPAGWSRWPPLLARPVQLEPGRPFWHRWG